MSNIQPLRIKILIILLWSSCVCASLRAQSHANVQGLGSSLLMQPDSLGTTWSGTSSVSFDNTTPDTAFLTEFMARPTNGASCVLHVFDGLKPIDSTLVIPQSQAHLTFVILSSRYNSFDTVTFSFHIYDKSSDTILRNMLPVKWIAFSGVAKNRSTRSNYVLPNPFTTHTTVGFSLSKPERIKLQLFEADLLMSKAAKLAAYQEAAGESDPIDMLCRLQLPLSAMSQIIDRAHEDG